MSTYRTGLQFDNQTKLPIVAGRIQFSTDDFEDNNFWFFFIDPQESTNGSIKTFSGAMNVAPSTWIDRFIEIKEGKGYDPIAVELSFADGHWIRFDDLQRRAYDYVSPKDPVSISVEQPEGRGVTDRISVSYWTRHDIAKYGHGMVTYAISDQRLTAGWMAGLDQTRKISEITIPGTHDSATWTVSGNAQCQSLDIRQQLDSGIRFIDIRLELLIDLPLPGGPPSPAPKSYSDLEIYHGLKATGLYFQKDVVSACKSFLAQNPGETVIMMISRNRIPLEEQAEKVLGLTAASEAQFAGNVAHLINDPIFRTDATVPTLGDAKGHIVLLTRYPGGPGIPLRSWPDDTEGPITEAGNKFYIQDVYGYGFPDGVGPAKQREKLDKKWSFIENNLQRAPLEGPRDGVWWFNLTSATGLPVLDPVDFAKGAAGAKGMNERTLNYLSSHDRGYYGVVPMDFPDPGLIQRLIATNA